MELSRSQDAWNAVCTQRSASQLDDLAALAPGMKADADPPGDASGWGSPPTVLPRIRSCRSKHLPRQRAEQDASRDVAAAPVCGASLQGHSWPGTAALSPMARKAAADMQNAWAAAVRL